jgi:hypothetical protein
MIATLTHSRRFQAAFRGSLRQLRPGLSLFTLLILFPALALAQSPFDTGFTAMQTLFTGTVAKVASLIAIVVGGYQFAHGEPGAKNRVRPPLRRPSIPRMPSRLYPKSLKAPPIVNERCSFNACNWRGVGVEPNCRRLVSKSALKPALSRSSLVAASRGALRVRAKSRERTSVASQERTGSYTGAYL